LGFGNISRRLESHGEAFVISGTQTGHLSELSNSHYALVTCAEPLQNRLESTGLCRPSSEALTHAAVYRQNHNIQAVIHVHSPELWQSTERFNLARTADHVAYGTPEMAAAVAQLFDVAQLGEMGLFSMLGHEDGIIAFGHSLPEAACLLIAQWANALRNPV
jgi:ribulose-5-phosphate 4-epimerase/fuculose-1-phosphate aldolase